MDTGMGEVWLVAAAAAAAALAAVEAVEAAAVEAAEAAETEAAEATVAYKRRTPCIPYGGSGRLEIVGRTIRRTACR